MNPIKNEIGTVFIPVKDIKKSKAWYCDLLNLPETDNIVAGHLYVMPMKGTGVVLDSKIYSEESVYKWPAFHFDTNDIEAAYSYMKEKGVVLTTAIENGHWFNFKDPDGNLLMICQ
ncbi:VOC family protein [Pseudalkalibacillus hwajinpoensis]|uniref:VOC family protein n=1 Tax=Guptibacillus hwajinpoensis TaxID=208199 RepID=UPI00325C102B